MSSQDLQTLTLVLEGFLNTNKEIRTQSEAKFNELSKNLQALIYCLSKIANESQNKPIKTFSLIAIRKLLDFGSDDKIESKWISFENSYKEEIKSNLYNALLSNTDDSLNSKICDTISMVAANIYDSEEKWDEIVKYIFDVLSQSSNLELVSSKPANFENAVFLLRHLFNLITVELLKGTQIILTAFKNFFSTNNLSLRAKTTEAISDIINTCEGKDKKHFKNFALNVLETTLKCAEDPKQESNLLICLTALSDISVNYKLFLKKHFSDLFILLGKLIEKTDYIDEHIRELCMEILVTMIEHYPSLLSKDEEKSKFFIQLIFKYADEMEDEITSDWLTPKVEALLNEEVIQEKKLEAAINFIGRLMTALKSSEKFFALIADIVMLLIQNDKHWKYKYIGYMTVSTMAENIDDIQDLANIFEHIFKDVTNENPKIKFACLFCLDAFSDSFSPIFQKHNHKTVVPLCLSLLRDPVLRIRLEALYTLETFFNEIDDEICMIYCENILNEVFSIFLQEEVQVILINSLVNLVTELVKTCDRRFAPFGPKCLDIFIEFFFKIYKMKINSSLFGPLIDVITTIGVICEEYFIKVLPSLIELSIDLQNSVTDSSDSILSYLQKSWNNIIPLINTHYPDSVPKIIESTLLLLTKQPKVKISQENGFEYDLQELFSQSSEGVKINKKKIDLNTAETNEFHNSIDLITVFIDGFDHKFVPFIEATESRVLPLLKYKINSDVRISAAYLLKDLLKNVRKNTNVTLLHQKAKVYISEIFSALETEDDYDVINTFLTVLKKLFKAAELFLSVTEINAFFSKLFEIFNSVEKSRIELLGKRDQTESDFKNEVIEKQIQKGKGQKSEEEDLFEDENELENDLDDIENKISTIEHILTSFSSIIGVIFKFHKELCMEVVNKLLAEYLPKYLADNSSVFDKKMGIFILDDMTEFLGQNILSNIWHEIIKILLKFADSKLCVLRQASVYGIGEFAKYTVSDYQKFCDDSLKALSYAIDMTSSDDDEEGNLEWNHARDNAIASLGKIIRYQGNHLDLNLWIPKWLSYLPLKYDVKEAHLQHKLLCEIIINKPEYLLGENNANLSKIIRILCKVYESKLSEESVDEMIKTILTNIKNNPALHPFVNEALVSAKKKIKAKIEKFFNN